MYHTTAGREEGWGWDRGVELEGRWGRTRGEGTRGVGVEGWIKVGGAEGVEQRGGARGVESKGWSQRGVEQERTTSPRVIVSQANFLILTLL